MLCSAIASSLSAYPSDPDWLFVSPEERRLIEEAQSLGHRFEFDRALETAERAVAAFPDSPNSHAARLQVFHLVDRLQVAVSEYSSRVEADPEDFLAHLCLAYAYYLNNTTLRAAESIEKALALNSDSALALHLDVMIARHLPKRRSEADRLARDLRERFPDYARAYVTEALWLIHRDASRKRIEEVIDAGMSLPVAPAGLFEIRDQRLQYESIWYDHAQGIEFYERALEIDPSRMDLALTRVYRLRQTGRTLEALEALFEILDQAPRFGQARLVTARALIDLRRYDEALEVLEAGLGITLHQPWYAPRAYRRRADALHLAGRHDEAIEELERLIQKFPALPHAREARQRMVDLLGRSSDATVTILDGVPYLTQKGNYCGPATLSMALGYWGLELDQDTIARDIYTGVVGTAPQVIREFARLRGFETASFEGSEEEWKRLIDAGIPILWLTRLSTGGMHYFLVVGYDDIFREFIVHNPHESTQRPVPYDSIQRKLFRIPDPVRSIALAPEGSPQAEVVATLEPTFRLRAINWLFFLGTGSNLFKGLWPALFVNALLALGLALLLLPPIVSATYPTPKRSAAVLVVAMVALVAVLNVLIVATRVNQAVSVLVGFYLAWATLLPLLLICMLLRWFTHDWFHPRELFSLAGIVFISWSARSLIDDGHWQDRIPILLLLSGFTWLLWKRWRMGQAVLRARIGPVADRPARPLETPPPPAPTPPTPLPSGEKRTPPRTARSIQTAVDLLRPLAHPDSGMNGYYAACFAMIETHLASLNTAEAIEAIQALRARRWRWGRATTEAFDLQEAAALTFSVLGAYPALTRAPDESTTNDGNSSEGLAARRLVFASEQAVRARALLTPLVGARRANTFVGAMARGLLGWMAAAEAATRETGEDETKQIAQWLDEAAAYGTTRRVWPRFPGVPRIGYRAWPHILPRALPLLVAKAQTLHANGQPNPTESRTDLDPDVRRVATRLSALLGDSEHETSPRPLPSSATNTPESAVASPASPAPPPAVRPTASGTVSRMERMLLDV